MYGPSSFCCEKKITRRMAAASPRAMKPYRIIDALAAEAFVFASRQAIGFIQTTRGLRVVSPVLILSFCRAHDFHDVVDCASRRSTTIDGSTSSALRKNMNDT